MFIIQWYVLVKGEMNSAKINKLAVLNVENIVQFSCIILIVHYAVLHVAFSLVQHVESTVGGLLYAFGFFNQI